MRPRCGPCEAGGRAGAQPELWQLREQRPLWELAERQPRSAELAAPGGPALAVGNRTEGLETFPVGNSRRPGAAAGLRASRAAPAAAVQRGAGVSGGGEGDGRVERHVGKFLEAPCPPSLGTPGSFPGIGTNLLGASGLGPGGSGESVPSLRLSSAPDRAGPGRSWGSGAPGTRDCTLEFLDHLRPARLRAPFPASSVAFGLGKGLGCAWYLGLGEARKKRTWHRGVRDAPGGERGSRS